MSNCDVPIAGLQARRKWVEQQYPVMWIDTLITVLQLESFYKKAPSAIGLFLFL